MKRKYAKPEEFQFYGAGDNEKSSVYKGVETVRLTFTQLALYLCL